MLILDDHMNPILSKEDCYCMTTLKDHFPRRILLQVHTQEKCVCSRAGEKFTRVMRQAQSNKIIKPLFFFFFHSFLVIFERIIKTQLLLLLRVLTFMFYFISWRSLHGASSPFCATMFFLSCKLGLGTLFRSRDLILLLVYVDILCFFFFVFVPYSFYICNERFRFPSLLLRNWSYSIF